MSSTASEIMDSIAVGWNLGNTLEAIGGETAWGNPETTQALFALVKANGFDAVRLPVSWDQYANQDTAEIQSAWMDRVEEVVGFALAEDLHVVLNIHWDGGWLEENVTAQAEDDVADKQRAFWQQIATRFRDYDERLIFASANEPNVDDAAQMAVLANYHQVFIDAVRDTGGRNAYRVLIVQGPRTDIELTDDLWNQMPVDQAVNKLVMEIHFYTPFQFTLMTEDASWGDMFYFWGENFNSTTNPDRNATWGEEEQVTALFQSMHDRFVTAGIPVIIGEYAAMRRTNLTGDDLDLHLASRDWYLEYVTREAVSMDMTPFYWDAGGLGNFGSGLFDRDNNTVFDDRALDAIMEGAGNTP
ncbi:glycoside hydrolase family 5 protein [Parvularcula flava]|nr:glycoside hydrolase family 5 protein [Aquisalinus luteolus]